MASTGINDGGIAKLLIKTVPTAGAGYVTGHLINCSINFSHDPREVTTKSATLGAKEYKPGLTGWTLSGEAYFAEDVKTVAVSGSTNSKNDYSTYLGYAQNRTLVYVWYGAYGVAGDNVYTGSGYITAINRTSGNTGENESFTVEIQGTGALTETTLST